MNRALNKAQGQLGNQQGTHKQLTERIDEQERALTERDKHISDIERQLQDAHQRISIFEEQDYDTLINDNTIVHQEAQENLELAQSYQQDLGDAIAQREELEEKLQKTGHALHTAYKDVKTLQQQLNKHKHNGGIHVYATPDLQERYQDLYTYTDNELDQPYSDIIDETINHICERIKEAGKSAQHEFDYMKQVKSYFYKKNDRPGKWTRIFFVTDWETEITIADITTPQEHQDSFSSNGRYKDIMDGRVNYDYTKRTRIHSIRELL